ncbi:hypothetical protein IAU59_004299 [Kwoniella sp. CBS 9459]
MTRAQISSGLLASGVSQRCTRNPCAALPFHISRISARSSSSTSAKAASATTPAPLTLHSISPYIRPHHQPSSPPASVRGDGRIPADFDFCFWPNFFDEAECKVLLEMALWKLDRVDSSIKRRRKGGKRSAAGSAMVSPMSRVGDERGGMEGLQALFKKEYGFEEGHYDSVIHKYRETLLSSLPPSSSWSSSLASTPDLSTTLTRLYSLLLNRDKLTSRSVPRPRDTSSASQSEGSLAITSNVSVTVDDLPPPGTITHLLHLSPEGEILPHVDNLQASGSVICGVSLGAERTLRLRKKKGEPGSQVEETAGGPGDAAYDGLGWDVRLPPGSVYLQKDTIRYGFEHSILPYSAEGSVWDGERLRAGHRISIMIRDTPTKPAQL